MLEIKRYFISLGKSCNMQCIYCHQGEEKPNYISPIATTENIVKFLPKRGKYDVTLYGGEPLLYWDVLVPLVNAIKENNPQVNIGMPTNGALLTVKKAKQLNELGISFRS